MSAARPAQIAVVVAPLAAALLALACGAGRPPAPAAGAGLPAVEMRHQIAFSGGGDIQVFDGYMIRAGERLLVRAFAGPGVDLFTVVRDGAAHAERLQIPALADRIDMARVGADIARVYLGGCPRPTGAQGGEAACAFYGEPMTERFDAGGRLVARSFPAAHGIGLTVAYDDFAPLPCGEQPRRVVLRWGGSANEMVIRLVACAALPGVDPAAFAVPPR